MFVFCVKLGLILALLVNVQSDLQVGPDPWDLGKSDKLSQIEDELSIPPDLRAIPKKKIQIEGGSTGVSYWFYKRMLAILLKAGQVQKNEDGSVSVSLQMKFDEKRWELLNEYTAINSDLTEDMIRRSMGLIEDAIYKPPIVAKVIVAWSDYICLYLIEYKMQITWTFGILATSTAAIWLWNHMSHKHIYIVIFLVLYIYEVLTSYKEAENEELQRFLSAVNKCKWNLWSSHCDVPPPDPLIFIKHMNPLKIGIRMFTTLITEPMISISDTVRVLVHGITDGLWFPLDKIMYGFLILNFNVLLILFLIMIVFNYIFNIPFNFSFLGLLNIGLKQRNRSFNTITTAESRNEDNDRISGATLNRLLDVCSQALSSAQSAQKAEKLSKEPKLLSGSTTRCTIRRSASTGRLPNAIFNGSSQLQVERLSKGSVKHNLSGSGDG